METTSFTIEQLRFPIGRYELPTVFQSALVKEALTEIEALPAQLEAVIQNLTEEQLDTPYRAGGWTIRQVIHHLPDSHMNSYIRFRMALTEDRPVIKPYEEAAWAQLPDAQYADPAFSMPLLKALHVRWALLLQGLTFEQWHRTYVHPEGGEVYLFQAIGLYAWHGKHHLAHITSLKERMGW